MSQLLIPVIHSIPDGVALIDTVLRHYPIRNVRSCKLYKRGLNYTYLVETEQERYILRVYRRGWRNKHSYWFWTGTVSVSTEAKAASCIPHFQKWSWFYNRNCSTRRNTLRGCIFLCTSQSIRKLSETELAAIPAFITAAHIWVMGISASLVEDVLAYGWFSDDWLDARLAMLKSLDDFEG